MTNIDNIVRLWYKTQRGHIKECRKAQMEFSDVMWELCEELDEKGTLFPEQQRLGDEAI